MSFSQFAVTNNRLTYSLVGLLMLLGISSYFSLPKDENPAFTIRTAVISTYWPGASPERVEQLVTDKIEQVVQQMPELDFLTSTTQGGSSSIFANFQQSYKDMQPIFDDLRRKVESTANELPRDVIGPFVNDEFGDVFGIIYTLTGDGFDYTELKLVADDVRDELLLLDQVAKVEIAGDQTETIFIDYNNARLRELGLSPQQLGNTLASVNILSSGGNVVIGSSRLTLEPSGNFESLDDIKRVIVSIPGSTEGVYLEDIADIYRGYVSPPDSKVHATGKPALTVSISMKEGGNILSLGDDLKAIMPDIKARYRHGIELTQIMFQPDIVDASVDSFMINLLQAIGIVLIVMLVFLGIRTGVVVAALIPGAMAITFVVMPMFDVGINKISLAALIIALGLLVDNGIVMSEGILVRMQKGEERIKAVIATGKELMIPLLTSSLTTSAAFLPIAMAKSMIGEFTADLAIVVTMTLIISWLLAMSFIPLLASALIKVKPQNPDNGDAFSGKGYAGYRVLLNFALKYKILFLTLIIALFVLSIKGLAYVPKTFIPASETPIVNAKFDLPVGTAIETTEAVALDIERFLTTEWAVSKEEAAAGKEGIFNWMTFVGTDAPRFVLSYSPGAPSTRHFALIANVTSVDLVPELSRSVNAYTREVYPDLEVQFKKLENGPSVAYPIQVRLLGKDKEILYGLSADVKQYLYSLPFVSAVSDDWGLQVKKLLIRIDQERARLAGVTSDDVAKSLTASLAGTDLTQFRENDKLIPVTLRSTASDREDLGKLEGITVYSSSTSAQVPLRQVADVEVVWQPGLIMRRDRLRAMTVNVQLNEGVTPTEANATLLPWLEEQSRKWPRGYRFEQGGEFEASGDATQSMVDELMLPLILIVLVLIAQFNSIRKPVIILCTIPLGMIGITMGLIIANSIFGFFTILALVSLAGIIINNAIVLLDRIKIETDENGLDERAAIFEACQQRLRPILLTTTTTVGGMLPLWISHDPMFETMAVSIIFGLIFATILTLVFVPVMYSIFFGVSFKGWDFKTHLAATNQTK